jgi:hypothetical protein
MSKSSIFNISLVDLEALRSKYGLETGFSQIDDIRKCLLDMKQGLKTNAF